MVEVSKQTLIRRINRKLAPDTRVLKTTRATNRRRDALGEYYVIHECFNAVTDKHVDLEAFGRGIGCLGAYEVLVD